MTNSLKNGVLSISSLGIALMICVCNSEILPDQRPNIILIMSDDMGYADIGCYGSEIKTPKLDGLAENGFRFTQFYNTAGCWPARASLMTGLYPHQAGVGHMMEDRGLEGYSGNLSRKAVAIAEVRCNGQFPLTCKPNTIVPRCQM